MLAVSGVVLIVVRAAGQVSHRFVSHRPTSHLAWLRHANGRINDILLHKSADILLHVLRHSFLQLFGHLLLHVRRHVRAPVL